MGWEAVNLKLLHEALAVKASEKENPL